MPDRVSALGSVAPLIHLPVPPRDADSQLSGRFLHEPDWDSYPHRALPGIAGAYVGACRLAAALRGEVLGSRTSSTNHLERPRVESYKSISLTMYYLMNLWINPAFNCS